MDSHDRSRELKKLICEDLEKILGYKFANKNLLLQAMTHR